MRAALASLVAAGGLFAGCTVDNDVAVFIEGSLPLSPASGCKIDGGSSIFQQSGTFDLLAISGYTTSLKARTNLPATFNSSDVALGDTQSPNYPSFGAADNNVIIFDGAEIEYSFQTDERTAQQLQRIVGDADFNFTGELTCADGGICTLGTRTVAAAGSVFNTQTSLNASAVIFAQALPPDLGIELARLYAAAANDDGDDTLALLRAPAERQRLLANISLLGTTTGNGDYKSIKSFPFQFPIDLCIGCLAPDEEFCKAREAIVVESGATCFIGVDFETSACFCEGETPGEPGETRIDRDEDVCKTLAP